MRKLLNLDETRRSPLMTGPYVSLSGTCEEGIAVANAVREDWLHHYLTQLISHPHLYGHQEQAIRALIGGRTTLVSTGTGSGKTECFLYPIISRCLQSSPETPAGNGCRRPTRCGCNCPAARGWRWLHPRTCRPAAAVN
jgi:ATP-dependent helicase YprA (DUF1998 family)